jgi:hypothetical protein
MNPLFPELKVKGMSGPLGGTPAGSRTHSRRESLAVDKTTPEKAVDGEVLEEAEKAELEKEIEKELERDGARKGSVSYHFKVPFFGFNFSLKC